MSSWKGQSKGTPLGYKILIFVCKQFGLIPAYAVLRVIVVYYVFFSWSTNKVMYHYFRKKQKFAALKSCFCIYENYYQLGQSILDRIIIMAGGKANYHIEFQGAEHVRQMIANGKGGILMSAHLGNWEAAGHMLERYNTKINVLMFEGESEKIKKFLDEERGERKFNVIGIKDDLSHVYKMSEVLHNNELVCMHADRFLPGTKTFEGIFFGGVADFPVGPFMIAAGFNVPVSFVFSFKVGLKNYLNMASELYMMQEGETKKEFIHRLQSAYIQSLEKKLKEYPLQWYNYYSFWK